MTFGHKKRFMPELNTTSTADISFMLLTFFLVTSSMDVDKGITRRLPPYTKQEQPVTTIGKESLMRISITADNRTLIDGKPVTAEQVVPAINELFNQAGKRHLIIIHCDPRAEYNVYFHLQNSLTTAYAQWRNRVAMQKYGLTYKKLPSERRDEVEKLCPQRVAEQYNGTSNMDEAGKGDRP